MCGFDNLKTRRLHGSLYSGWITRYIREFNLSSNSNTNTDTDTDVYASVLILVLGILKR
jgi:hypothetical protein